MKLIPIDNELKDFKRYLDSNDRCIFSARFGDGKSYFLSKFIKKHQKQYLFIPIYPVNYQVAGNKDIFEYIKRDILIRLLASGEVDIDDTIISNSIYLYNYLQQNKINVSSDLLNVAPDINLNGTDISLSSFGLVIKAFNKLKSKFEEYKSKFKNDEQKVEAFLEFKEKGKGSIYEFDIISQLICNLIAQYKAKYKSRRKVVLLIEDLDRIDPEHIFRILNIFSAHFDRYDVGYTEIVKTQGRNKFNLDKIITVCHYENIENIYHHLYGEKTDFNGYIGKFSTAKPFNYSLIYKFKEYIFNNIDPKLMKYQVICDTICVLILEKYINNSDNCIKSNLRHINAALKQYIPIVEKQIQIQPYIKISTNNDLTSFLCILQKFDITWGNLVQRLNGSKKEEGLSELNKIIGCCWFYAKVLDNRFRFEYNIVKGTISCGYTESIYNISLPIPIKEDLIIDFDINQIKNNEFLNKIYVALKSHESNIIEYFNSFLNNHRKETVK